MFTLQKYTPGPRSLAHLLCLMVLLINLRAAGQTDLPITSLTVSTDTMSHPASVGKLMEKLKSIPDLHLAFDQSAMDMNKKIKLPSGKDLTVQEIMALVSNATGMTYEVIGKQIVLKKAVKPMNLQKFTISGQITDGATGEDLIGATVRIEELNIGSVSNVYGFYSITLDQGLYKITYSFVGYDSQSFELDLSSDVKKNVELNESKELLNEVVVVAEKEADFNVTAVEMSSIDVSIEAVKKMPALFGEVDVIKTIQLLPGVKTVGEGSSGFYVRGGNVDQNLVLLDEAPIYNASHLFGFFSAFNPEAIKDMKLYKGAMPANYGGRLSSVLDIRMKEGNAKKFQGSGGIGLLMSRLALEAPITEKGSFMIGGRRSYMDVMANTYSQLRGKGNSDNKFFFYDLNAKANYRLNDKNRLFLSGYFGKDLWAFDISDDFKLGMAWSNTTGTARWNHIFSPRLFSNMTYYYSNYNYNIDFELDAFHIDWTSNLREHSIKADFGAYLNPKNTMKFGLHTILHEIDPANMKSFGEDNEVISTLKLETNKSYEHAVYVSNEQQIGSKLVADYGVRYSWFQNIGPQETYRYDDQFEIADTVQHGGKIFNTAGNFEPRLGFRYQLNSSSSLKTSYNRTAQYIHLASNGNFASPFDVWFSSSEHVKPQLADQFAFGYFKNFNDNAVEFSAEVYYKDFQNSIDFKDHAELALNTNLEGELRFGKMRAYGLELMAKKNKGKLTGWVSYTLSKAEKKIETINNNNWYNAKHDKPHDVSVVASYQLTDRLSIGSNFVYATGGAVTFPTGRASYQGVIYPIYSERNGARLPDYHRLDLSVTLQSKKNSSRRLQTEWVFSGYNVYQRKNAFAINFYQDEINTNLTYAEKQAIFGFVPSVTFNARF